MGYVWFRCWWDVRVSCMVSSWKWVGWGFGESTRLGVTSIEAGGGYGVMDPERAERGKEEIKHRIQATPPFKGCLEEKKPRERDRGAGRRSVQCGGGLDSSLRSLLAPTL